MLNKHIIFIYNDTTVTYFMLEFRYFNFHEKNQPQIVQHNEPQYISFVGDIIQSEALYLLYPFNWF